MSKKSIRFNNRGSAFPDGFVYSDDSIDGQSKKKAYTFVDSGLLDSMKPGTVKCLQQIHAYIFGGLFDFAGKIRTKTISKGNTIFCLAEYLHDSTIFPAMGKRLGIVAGQANC